MRRAWTGRLGILFALLGTAWPLLSQVRFQAPSTAQVSAGARQPLVSGSGTIVYRGRELTYELVDGLAIHDGDMVLGMPGNGVETRANRPAREACNGRLAPQTGHLPGACRVPLAEAIIPFVIEPGFTDVARREIQEAIDHWNSRTVVTLVPRQAEADFVRFRPEPVSPTHSSCVADLGRRGGEQSIFLVDANGCGVGPTIHEIGHTVGLEHEHQRLDRDQYVIVPGQGIDYVLDSPGWRAVRLCLDHALRRDRDHPSGMLVSGQGLSSGDIDGVARIYGRPPRPRRSRRIRPDSRSSSMVGVW